jgi:hypothetical protein
MEIMAADTYVNALEAVAEAARNVHTCFDHADDCCAEWCRQCKSGEASKEALDKALKNLDAVRSRKPVLMPIEPTKPDPFVHDDSDEPKRKH